MKKTALRILLQSAFLLPLMLAVVLAGCGSKKKINRTLSGDGSAIGSQDGSGEYGKNGKRQTGPGTTTDSDLDRDYANLDDPNAPGNRTHNRGGETGVEGAPIPELQTIYFELDSDQLDEAALTALNRNASYLDQNTGLQVVLRGHTDDRGTEEYNFALGSRRAENVRDYLIDKGINKDRLETVSFGETLRLVETEDDSARAQNRRVEFFVYTVDQ